MEQKTEASQAVDEFQLNLNAFQSYEAFEIYANEVRNLRAALKAQPAPTEATAKPAAHVWFHRGLLNFDGEDEMLLKLDDGMGTSIPLYLRPPAPTEAAQGEDSARLVDMLDEIMQSVPRNMGRWDGGNAPGHCHTVIGIWDSDNGAKAGTKCAWCEIWQRADSEVKKHRARASAETVGVKP